MSFNLGNALNVAGQPDEAARAFERAVAINPEFAAAHQNLGVFHASRGDLPRALVHLKRAAELAPDSAEVLGDLGALFGQAGQIEEGIRVLQRALELRPDYAPARENLQRLERRRR